MTPSAALADRELQVEDLYASARGDFGTFVELAFPILHPCKKFAHAAYLDVLFALMEDCAAGREPRVIVNLPPGFMKSMLISIMYVAWRLGVDPTLKFVCISYGDDLAHKHSASTRTLMQSPEYRAIFPGTVLDKKAENWLTTTKGGYRYATAVGSDITGFRPTEIIVDDPIEPEKGSSELAKGKIRSWISSSVLTRFEDNAKNVFILVMHRVAPDDLAGTLQEQGGYRIVSLPLVAEKEEVFESQGDTIMTRQPGDLLHPGRMTEEQLERLKREISPHAFASQYQQRPVLGGSGMCSINRLARYDKPPKFELTMHSWDIGATLEGNPSVCTKWGVTADPAGRDNIYLTDVVRLKLEMPDVRAAMKAHDKLDKPDLIVLDHRGVGIGVEQELRKAGYRHLYAASKDGTSNESKIDRFGRALIPMYDGVVKYPVSAPFLDDVLYALATFPELKEFDLIDSITQLVAFMPTTLKFARQKHRSMDL
jgi:phage terminase large subunit-like protein